MVDVAQRAGVVDVDQAQREAARVDDGARALVAFERGEQRPVGAREAHRMPALAAERGGRDLGAVAQRVRQRSTRLGLWRR